MKRRISIRLLLGGTLSLLLLFLIGSWMVQRSVAQSRATVAVSYPRSYFSVSKQNPLALRDHVALRLQVQQEKTVDQARKNIQVFKGLPDWQLIPVMNFMSTSLGVKCNYCHVNNNGNWTFDLDDKPEKQTAREMIKMVLNVNKTTFRGNTEVSCFTCHRGRTSPVSVPTFPLPEPPQRPAARGSAAANGAAGQPGTPSGAGPGTGQTQLSADEILNKYVAAVGGQGAIDKLKTRVMKGTSVNANGVTVTFEIYQSAPDKFYMLLNAPRGMMERAFNGTMGWEKNQGGVHEITGQQLNDLRRTWQLFGDLKIKEQFTRMNVGKDKIDGRDVNVIRGVVSDRRRERLYFDAETGLLLRRISYMETPIGVIPEQVDFDDYREVDGVKIPFTVRISAIDSNASGTRKFTDVKINVPVDDAKFSKPAAS